MMSRHVGSAIPASGSPGRSCSHGADRRGSLSGRPWSTGRRARAPWTSSIEASLWSPRWPRRTPATEIGRPDAAHRQERQARRAPAEHTLGEVGGGELPIDDSVTGASSGLPMNRRIAGRPAARSAASPHQSTQRGPETDHHEAVPQTATLEEGPRRTRIGLLPEAPDAVEQAPPRSRRSPGPADSIHIRSRGDPVQSEERPHRSGVPCTNIEGRIHVRHELRVVGYCSGPRAGSPTGSFGATAASRSSE